ncbi:carboxypeptidase regulatory-like domain-containing protein [Sinosporangium siamense]|uniref:alpha-amylase n=1 Tax=Sinosporangium siamense TaxID=1367973 RepID=A0A919V7C6_9ACTN|nr:carboxypeptidase regulatory-like domain-containing protein [Sinosporangium siamense]GII94980.1 hypothetical protein Ssi02_52110 [Sinosporangium siamense]
MPHTPRRWRTILTGSAVAFTILLPPGTANAVPPPGPQKIDQALLADLSKGGKTRFLVRMKGGADLGAARNTATKAGKGARVYQAKTAAAASSQAKLRSLLSGRKADFTPLWIVNAVRVAGDAGLAGEIAKLPEVERIEPDSVLEKPRGRTAGRPATTQAQVNGVEWNIDRIGAPQVWSEFGTRGEGVVVGSISSLVQFDHPAVAAQYRGKKADGSVDHNYNRVDFGECGNTNSPVPSRCTNVTSLGTPHMGVMVGGTATDQIGVAPGAKWINAAGCEGTYCYTSTLLEAGQWMLAPTDLQGRNPRPDLAPDIVSNSWGLPAGHRPGGGPGYNRFYKEIVDAWVAAGIFPALDIGLNSRDYECGSSYSPGQYTGGYAAGAFGPDNVVPPAVGRGPGEDGAAKPDIAAPGVGVRSAQLGGGYRTWADTSLAAAHVAGTVALMWSAAPSLYRDIPATRALLDRTAIDAEDTSCGGTAAKNNVYGEGRLSAYAAVRDAPRSAVGALGGTVASGGAKVAEALVTVGNRTTVTAADGTYRFPRLAVGTHRVIVKKAGYAEAGAGVTVTAGATVTHDVELPPAAARTVSGVVGLEGVPQAGATVHLADTPVSAVTDAAGAYRLSVADGEHRLKVTVPGATCAGSATVPITVAGDLTKDIALPRRTDDFGYVCVSGTEPYVAGTERQAGAPNAAPVVTLPFEFPFYTGSYRKATLSSSGFLIFGEQPAFYSVGGNDRIPTKLISYPAIYPFWDDLVVDGQGGIYTARVGTAPERSYIVEWRNVAIRADLTKRISFSLILGENGSIGFRYRGTAGGLAGGGSATVGMEGMSTIHSNGFKAGDNKSFLYSYNKPVLADGRSLTFTSAGHGLIGGTVSNANDGRPLAGATVKIGDTVTVTTSEDGAYAAYAPPGEQQVTVSMEQYGTVTRRATVAVGERTPLHVPLVTGRVSADRSSVEVVVPGGQTRAGTFTLSNLGTAASAFTVEHDRTLGWLSVSPASGELAPGASATITVTGSAAGLQPGSFRTGELVVTSASARNPKIRIPVTAVVPGQRIAVDAGGTREVTDALGDRWSADRAYTPGGYGYMGAQSGTHTATGTIRGTGEQELFKTARESLLEYRFDNLPNGIYTVELGFAETRDRRPGERIFSVTAEGELAVPILDLAQDVGAGTATTRTYTVKVADGQLNVRFAAQRGGPVVNAVRVTERPDKTTP